MRLSQDDSGCILIRISASETKNPFLSKLEALDRNNFEKEIKNALIKQKISPKGFLTFKNIVLEALNLHAPLKTKYLRANHSSFISKYLSKAIMHRLKLRNQFLKLQAHESTVKYSKQRNLCVTLL